MPSPQLYNTSVKLTQPPQPTGQAQARKPTQQVKHIPASILHVAKTKLLEKAADSKNNINKAYVQP